MKKEIRLLKVAVALGAAAFGFRSAAAAAAEPLDIGAEAPDVESVTHEGKAIDLGAQLAEGTALVYFYPKADTPGCTKQACSIRDAYESLTEKGLKVFGVSMDTVEDQAAFREKYSLPFTLIADKEGKVVDAFGVPELREGIAARQAFLFRDGKVIWRDLKASTEQQAADVLKALEEAK